MLKNDRIRILSSRHETFTKTEIIQSMVFDHNGVKLEISNTKISVKSPDIWKLNNMLLRTHVKEEITWKLEDI